MANEPGSDRRVHINEGTLKKNLNPPPVTNRPPVSPPKKQGE
jgi:hypothetical protein